MLFLVLPCPQFVLCSDGDTITLSYRRRVSIISYLYQDLYIKTKYLKNKRKPRILKKKNKNNKQTYLYISTSDVRNKMDLPL